MAETVEIVLDRKAKGVSRRPEASGSLYRMVWRWHFYAGLFVSPVLMIVAVTGAIYVFRSEIEDSVQSQYRFVEPGLSTVGPTALIELAKKAYPEKNPTELIFPGGPRRSAIVRFAGEAGKPGRIAYLDPYRGVLLNPNQPLEEDALDTFFHVVLDIHRELFLGSFGRIVVELTVGWTIVLLISGLYLWWPKRYRQTLGVWWYRFRAKPYTILRDLHAVTGFYLLIPAFVIVVTGLFYAIVWSEAFYQVTRNRNLASTSTIKDDKNVETKADPRTNPLPFDRLVELARSRHPAWELTVPLKINNAPGIEFRAANDFNNSYGPYRSDQFRLDRFDGKVLSSRTLWDDERYWWHGWTYPLHVGSVLGPTTKVIWFSTCLVLCGLPATGLWMWLKRRPRDQNGFPRRPERPIPRTFLALIFSLAVVLPTVGFSMILIVGVERVARLVRNSW